jgi:hypothetical protein
MVNTVYNSKPSFCRGPLLKYYKQHTKLNLLYISIANAASDAGENTPRIKTMGLIEVK